MLIRDILKRWNYFLYYIDRLRGNPAHYLHKPYLVQIEPTLRCNLDCPMCNTHIRNRAANKDMSFNDFKIIVVTYHGGFREPFQNVMPDTVRQELEQKGAKVISATHALSGVERSIAKKYTGSYPVLLIADTLRLFGAGTKVAVEVTIMAADAGVLTGNDVIALGGTGRGADTALVIKPVNQSDLFDMRIREVICKPREF